MKQLLGIKVEKLAMGGFGIAFHDKKAIFIPYSAPGDMVDVIVTHDRKDHSFARVNRFISRGDSFVQPDCSAFGGENPCGGCDWLMLSYDEQVKQKYELVKSLFLPFIDSEKVYPTISSPQPVHYRNKVFMPVGEGKGKRSLQYGIFARWSHQIVPHTACKNHPPVFDALAKRIIELCIAAKVSPYNELQHSGNLRHLGFRISADGSEILVVLVTLSGKLPFSGLLVKHISQEFPSVKGIIQNINREKGNVILGADTRILYGRDHIFDRLGNTSFRISYRSFWQINIGTMELIMNSIRKHIKPKATVLDAFCGIGAIGLSLANEVKSLILLEELPEAISDAKENAALNGIENVSFVCGKFEELLPELLQKQHPDVIIVDPPRSGLAKDSLETIMFAGIKQVIYLSCSPMTLARDLKVLCSNQSYELDSLQSFDMFPNTWHIECLAILHRR
ncbi:MAG: 23S rRNA (uracil(1939)-C(5))-methyltransferase RlmD [Candidatus Cloacimonetes bacterium]|nr:23S rRNA (uracil(1939)-C(5))-methyltransferase RlmD [Candidatus Cloacimonadota bacterium]